MQFHLQFLELPITRTNVVSLRGTTNRDSTVHLCLGEGKVPDGGEVGVLGSTLLVVVYSEEPDPMHLGHFCVNVNVGNC